MLSRDGYGVCLLGLTKQKEIKEKQLFAGKKRKNIKDFYLNLTVYERTKGKFFIF